MTDIDPSRPEQVLCSRCQGTKRVQSLIGLANTNPTEYVADGFVACPACAGTLAEGSDVCEVSSVRPEQTDEELAHEWLVSLWGPVEIREETQSDGSVAYEVADPPCMLGCGSTRLRALIKALYAAAVVHALNKDDEITSLRNQLAERDRELASVRNAFRTLDRVLGRG